jgi:hypothetical protein
MKRLIILLAILLAGTLLQAQSYRFLKVETLHSNNHKWQELEWLVDDIAHPQPKLTSNSSNGMLTYGGGGESYRPYDGDTETHAWIGAIEPPNIHYITIDLGEGNEIDPESLLITKPSYSLIYAFRAWASNDDLNWELMLDTANINSSGHAQMTFLLSEIQDTVAPTVPQDIVELVRTTRSFSIGWSPSSDDRDVTGYEVFLDGVVNASTSATSFLVDGLDSGTSYETFIRAFDKAGNYSENSDTLVVSTKIPDTEPPTDPENLFLTNSRYNMLEFGWDPSFDNDELAGYLIYLNGVIAGISEENNFAIPGLEPDSLYAIRVIAKDASGLLSPGYVEEEFSTGIDLPERMLIGTNFWNLGWGGYANDPFVDGYQNVTGDNPWKEEFLDETAFYSHYRYMDWLETNGSGLSSWMDRPQKADYNQRPMAFEWMIDLCNRQGVDLWITVPHLVVSSIGMEGGDNHFMKKLAILVKTGVDMQDLDLDDAVFENISELTPMELISLGGVRRCLPLDPKLKFYLEYSNETWNSGFSQTAYSIVQGTALTLPGDQYSQGRRFHAWAAIKLFEAAEDVFGAGNPRIMRMDAYQAVMPSQISEHYLIYKTAKYNPRNIFPDAFCPAPYFGNSQDGSSPDIFDDLIYGSGGIIARTEAVKSARTILQNEQSNGFPVSKLISYEGGQHLLTNADDASNNKFMYELYVRYLDKMDQYLDEFSHYLHCGTFGSGGAWGSKAYIGQPIEEAHKYRALYEWNAGSAIHPDLEIPLPPSELSYSELTENGYRLHWTPGTDNDTVVSYMILVKGEEYGTTRDTTLSISGLLPGRNYINNVVSVDSSGNSSDPSEDLLVVTDGTASYTVTFLVTGDDDEEPIDGAIVIFNTEEQLTNTQGIAEYAELSGGENLDYSISSSGYHDESGSIESVSDDLLIEVELQWITGFQRFKTEIEIYPNPVTNTLYVQSDQMINALSIIDISGRELISAKILGLSYSLDISPCQSGTYLLRIEMEDGQQLRRAVIKK